MIYVKPDANKDINVALDHFKSKPIPYNEEGNPLNGD